MNRDKTESKLSGIQDTTKLIDRRIDYLEHQITNMTTKINMNDTRLDILMNLGDDFQKIKYMQIALEDKFKVLSTRQEKIEKWADNIEERAVEAFNTQSRNFVQEHNKKILEARKVW